MKVEDRRKDRISFMPALLSGILTILVGSYVYILIFVEVPPRNNEVLVLIIGLVVGEWKNSMGYWWQSTRSSEEKNKLLANSIPAPVRREENENDRIN